MAKPSEIMGKAAGKVKEAGAAIMGDRGILLRLKDEHTQVSMLLKSIVGTKDPKERMEMFSKCRTELLSHAHAEQEEFYSVLASYEQTSGIIEHSIDEHEEIEALCDELLAEDPSADDWTAKCQELLDVVKDHVREEENELMPKAKDLLDTARLEALDRAYVERRQEEKQLLERGLPA